MISLNAYDNFQAASTEVMNFLHSKLGFKLWMVTRTESDDWIVLNAKDHGYDVSAGDVFRWTDSFCSRMVEGKGPRIAPRSDDIPAYADAPIGRSVPIGSYVGVPLTRSNQEIFGTLCAIDPDPMPEEICRELPMVEMMARLLTTILENELKVEEQSRRAERASADAMTDALTGLYNRRGWDDLLMTEEERCRRYGHPAGVVVIDLNNLKRVNDEQGHAQGDALIQRTAESLKSVTRESDVVARLGGDEFAILAVECDRRGADALIDRLQAEFQYAGLSASIGVSMRAASASLRDALEIADQKMYEKKRQQKQSIGQPMSFQ